jgi:hypothetical protein
MQVSAAEALEASHLPFIASSHDYYYESIEGKVSRADEVFDMLQEGFKRRLFKNDLYPSGRLDFASQKLNAGLSDHDTLQTLHLRAKRIHRALPKSYSDDLHLRDFLLRAYSAESFCSRVPEEPAKSYPDVHAAHAYALYAISLQRLRCLPSSTRPFVLPILSCPATSS